MYPRSLCGVALVTTLTAALLLAPFASAGGYPPVQPGDPPLMQTLSAANNWGDLKFFHAVQAASKEEIDVGRDAQGDAILHIVARERFENEATMLLRRGADPNVRDRQGRTPLHLVAKQSHEDAWMIRDMLAVASAEIDPLDNEGHTPLMRAAEAGNLRTVEFLIWLGASLNPHPENPAKSPLAVAQALGHADVVAYVQEALNTPPITLKGQPKLVPAFVQRAFVKAAAMADFETLERTLQEGADLDGKDAEGATALHRATYRAHEDVVTYLILLGADPNSTDKWGNTPFMSCAGWFGLSMDWMRGVMIMAGAHADSVNKDGYTTLTQNLRRLNEHGSQWAILMGASPTDMTAKGTPMRVACEFKDQRMIDLLRANGVTEAEWEDPDPAWQLESAVQRNQMDKVRQLVAAGGDLNQLNREGQTLINAAIHTRRIGMAKLLIELGADPALKNKRGEDALRSTCAWNYGEVNQFRAELIKAGADVNTVANNGSNALIGAASFGADWTGLRQLVEAGANLELADNNGETILDHALRSGRTSAADYLIQRGAIRHAPKAEK